MNYLRPDRSVEDRHTIAEKGLEMAMKMIFLHDFVHGDLHPVRSVRTVLFSIKWLLGLIDCCRCFIGIT